MKRKILAVMLLALMLVGCVSTDENTTVIEKNNNKNIMIWTDEENGVQYVIYNNGYGSGITPRLNADGTVMVVEGGSHD